MGGCIQASYNDLEAFPQAMGDGLQLSLRAPRENAAHGSYWAFTTGAASSRAVCNSFGRCRGVKYRALQYYRAVGVSRCSCDIKQGPTTHVVSSPQTSGKTRIKIHTRMAHTVVFRFGHIKNR
jgi:hypothetical protein